jgi:Proteasome assembly chaperone 4
METLYRNAEFAYNWHLIDEHKKSRAHVRVIRSMRNDVRDERKDADRLYVYVGAAACTFGREIWRQNLVEDARPLASLVCSDTDFSSVQVSLSSAGNPVSCLYSFKSKVDKKTRVLALFVRANVCDSLAPLWTDALLGLVDAKRVDVFAELGHAQLVAGLHGDDHGDRCEPQLRSLATSAFADDVGARELEVGNVVDALPAALLSACERRHVPALLTLSIVPVGADPQSRAAIFGGEQSTSSERAPSSSMLARDSSGAESVFE